jgi:hypothetical protein
MSLKPELFSKPAFKRAAEKHIPADRFDTEPENIFGFDLSEKDEEY